MAQTKAQRSASALKAARTRKQNATIKAEAAGKTASKRKRTVAKKTTARRTVAKKTTARRTVAKKTTARRTVAKKTTARRTVAKKTVTKSKGRKR